MGFVLKRRTHTASGRPALQDIKAPRARIAPIIQICH